MANAGSSVRLKLSGAAVAFTAEAVSTVTTNLVYQITNTAKRVWDRSIAITVKDGGTPVNAVTDPYTINRLTGTVTFASTAVRVITIDGSYLPLTTIAEAKEFDVTTTGDNQVDCQFTDTDATRVVVGRDCSGSVGRWMTSDTVLHDAYSAGVPVVLEFSHDGGSSIDLRVWGILNTNGISASRKSLITEGASFEGAADVDGHSQAWLQ